ncbi:mechanosensitive ion channel family protein [Fodinicola feengrottensis]|uniref:Mechanosensitive ion channel n=1 Tax=Fodinicola feengrottensis TaxID=435914 RepID=A0ABP4U7P2_9ACTN|nr:mechanosensitive ion channel family protein [Fodinicola feengrottensis]
MESLLRILAAKPDCATDAGSVCQSVWQATGVGWLSAGSEYLVATPLKILLVIVLAVVVRWVTHRLIKRLVRTTTEGKLPVVLRPLSEHAPLARAAAGLVPERRHQRAKTIGSVLRSVTSIVIGAVAVLTILGQLGINLAPLLASAGIAGVALGFGAQTLVRDFLSGIFMILEDQYGVGDTVDVGEASGTVEAVGLRCTQLRDVHGTVWYVRNGEVIRVGNRSQGWAVVVIDVPLPYGTQLDQASSVIRTAAQTLADDERFATDLLDPPEVLGIEQMTNLGITVRVTVKTTTDSQWRVGRELRRRLSDALDEASITSALGGQLYLRAPATSAAP